MVLTKQAARDAYRAAWQTYLLSPRDSVRTACEQAMDAAQPWCVEGGKPGAEWEAFIDELPGYRAWWVRWAERFCK